MFREHEIRPVPNHATRRAEAWRHVRQLANWLTKLPKPMVMASNDERAQRC